MILVLADDLSGAAECAAVARHHGLTAEVQTVPDPSARADVVVVDTDSRSLPPAGAAAATGRACRAMLTARPEWVFKKVDSVLRGPVAAEVSAVLRATGMTRAELVPANPHRGRWVCGGRYYVGDEPLDRTAFAADPEYPADTSDVWAIIRRRSGVRFGTGLTVPDVRTVDDMNVVASRLGPDTLPAGGSGLFSALLRIRAARRGRPSDPIQMRTRPGPVFGVRGSAYPAADHPGGVPVIAFDPAGPVEASADEVARALADRNAALLTLAPVSTTADQPADCLTALGACAAKILGQVSVGRLLLDGGATASVILRRLGWSRLTAVKPLSLDLVSLRDIGGRSPEVIVKPGSYPWVPDVWNSP